MKRSTIYILLLLCLVFNVYANVYGGEFAYDDYYFIRDNPGVHTLSNFGTFFTDISRTSSQELQFDVYRPLTTVSFAITHALFGLNPLPYHVTNIVLHALNVMLVFFLLRRVTGDETKAVLAAAIFAVHPAQVEAVSWISARGNVQSLLFMLLAFLAFLKWRDHGSPATKSSAGRRITDHGSRSWLYALSLILYILSMFSKESGIVLPALLFAWLAFVPPTWRAGPSKERRATLWRHALRLVPFLAAAVAFLILRTLILGQLGQMSLHGGNPFAHALFATQTIASYLKIVIAPIALTIIHDIPTTETLYGPASGIALSAIVLAVYLPLRLGKRSFLYPLGMAWFFIALAPAMNIVPIRTFTDERFLYAPLIGFALIAVQGAYDLGALLPWKRTAVAFLLCLITLYSARTIMRNRDWAGPIPLWESAARVNPVSSRAMYSLGFEHDRRGHYDTAMGYYIEAMRGHDITGMYAMTNIARMLERRGEIERAMFVNEESMKLYPEKSHAYINQAWILMTKLGDYGRAEQLLDRALDLDPDLYYVHAALAYLYENTSRPEAAKRHRERASRLNPAFGITGVKKR